jgi:hypothetical protein
MKFFQNIFKEKVVSRIVEEQLYEAVYQELEGGVRRGGLWAKAIADSNGNEQLAKSLYIKYRVQSIIDEDQVKQFAEQAKKTEVEEQQYRANVKANELREKEELKQDEELKKKYPFGVPKYYEQNNKNS